MLANTGDQLPIIPRFNIAPTHRDLPVSTRHPVEAITTAFPDREARSGNLS